MATDYDAPRKSDEEVREDSIEELKNHRNEQNSGKVDQDEVCLLYTSPSPRD